VAIHNETLAAQRPPHPEQIYYCANRAVQGNEGSEGYLIMCKLGPTIWCDMVPVGLGAIALCIVWLNRNV
jgi:hypothetical protein